LVHCFLYTKKHGAILSNKWWGWPHLYFIILEQYKIKGTPTIISNGSRIDCEVPDEIMLLNMLAGKK